MVPQYLCCIVADKSFITSNSFFTSEKRIPCYHKLVIIRGSISGSYVANLEVDDSELNLNRFTGLAYECLNEDFVYTLVCPQAQK